MRSTAGPARAALGAALVLAAVVTAGLAVPGGAEAAPAGPEPEAGCAPVALFAVPGSTETDEQADPAQARGLLAGLTDPLRERHDASRLHVEYLAYPATIDRPPYPVSQLRGVEALDRVTADRRARCPGTRIVLVGYSQGGDVVSDLVHRAQRGTVDVPPDDIAGAVMLGSPRRDPDGPNLVEAPGRGILVPRPTRELEVYEGRVVEVCAAQDPICASEGFSIGGFREGLASGAHRSYPTLPVGADQQPLYDVLGAALDDLVDAAAPRSPSTQSPPRPPAVVQAGTGVG